MANKRIQNKLMKLAQPRELTVQEAWDKVVEHLAYTYPNQYPCYFADVNTGAFRHLTLHSGSENIFLTSTNEYGKH